MMIKRAMEIVREVSGEGRIWRAIAEDIKANDSFNLHSSDIFFSPPCPLPLLAVHRLILRFAALASEGGGVFYKTYSRILL
jgi:hypothetical protein